MMYYYCYSESVMKHLKNNGVKYITQAKSCSTDKIFWLYKKDQCFDKVMLMYKK